MFKDCLHFHSLKINFKPGIFLAYPLRFDCLEIQFPMNDFLIKKMQEDHANYL